MTWVDVFEATQASILDVIDDTMTAPIEIESKLRFATVSDLGGGAIAFQWSEPSVSRLRIYASGRWSPTLIGVPLRASDGRIFLSGPELRWYDPSSGAVSSPVARPFDTTTYVAYVALSGGRVAAIHSGPELSVAVHDGKSWVTKVSKDSNWYFVAGEDFVGYRTTNPYSRLAAPFQVQHLRLDRIAEGFGAPVVVSTSASSPGVTIQARYLDGPAAGLVVRDGVIRFTGAVAACATCPTTTIDRALGPDGWSAPTDLGFSAATLQDVFFENGIIHDRTAQRVIALVDGVWSKPLDVAPPVSRANLTIGLRGAAVVGNAWANDTSRQWIGALRPSLGGSALAWIETAPSPSFSVFSKNGPPRLGVIADAGGGFARAGAADGMATIARFTPAPRISVWRTSPTVGALLSTSPHAGVFTTERRATSSEAKDATEFVDAWNDLGTSDRLSFPANNGGFTAVAIRCGAVLLGRRGDDIIELTRLSGE